MLRYGKQLHKIIMEAIEGEDSEEFGPRIFDLSTNGVSFKIRCENQGEFPTYVSSRFTSASKLNLSEDEQKKIYDGTFDLTKVYSLKSYDELKQMLDEHYYCKSTDKAEPEVQTYTKPATQQVESVEASPFKATQYQDTSIDDEIDELLKDL